MKHKLTLSIFAAMMTLTTGNALAGGASLLGGSGASNMEEGAMYGGASLGQAKTNCIMADGFQYEEDCNTSGWKVFGGYKITDMIAVEGGYHNLGESEENLTRSGLTVKQGDGKETPVDSKIAKGKATGLSLSGVLTMPVMDNLEVMGKAGVMKWSSEADTYAMKNGVTAVGPSKEVDGTSFLWGVGASYKITDNWGVRGEYEGFTREDIHGKEHDVRILSAGAVYSTL
ncbi:MAG: hypothetical protein CR991_08375 [Proteobacteria bacterium]|nr:MAG: hypothetical protein CR991_08375 [Pseudomonadota bacterium]